MAGLLTAVIMFHPIENCYEKLLQQLFGKVAQELEKKTPQKLLWCNRHVLVVDGSTVSMSDTKLRSKKSPLIHEKRLDTSNPTTRSERNLV